MKTFGVLESLTFLFLHSIEQCIFYGIIIHFKIFVPEQDASWELEGDHFEELEQRYSKCDAEVCLCPAGREDEEDFTEWEIVRRFAVNSRHYHYS